METPYRWFPKSDPRRQETDRAYSKAHDLLNPRNIDEKTVAERQWQKSKLAPKPQEQCDIGLFSDDKDQLDLLTHTQTR